MVNVGFNCRGSGERGNVLTCKTRDDHVGEYSGAKEADQSNESFKDVNDVEDDEHFILEVVSLSLREEKGHLQPEDDGVYGRPQRRAFDRHERL